MFPLGSSLSIKLSVIFTPSICKLLIMQNTAALSITDIQPMMPKGAAKCKLQSCCSYF